MTSELGGIEREIGKLPGSVLAEFLRAKELLRDMLGEEELLLWAREGLDIGTQTTRSWEAVVECFRASPEMARYLVFPSFVQWARCGKDLCRDAPSIASAYFRAGPRVVAHIRPQHIPRWAEVGRSLYKGTWKSGTLAVRFFDLSPSILQHVPLWEVELFAAVLESVSRKSYDVATECLHLGAKLLVEMGRERGGYLSLCRAMAERSWRDLRNVITLTSETLSAVEEGQRPRFLRLAEHLVISGMPEVSRFFGEAGRALSRIPAPQHEYIMDLCERVMPLCPEAVPALLRSLPEALERVTSRQLESWVQQGMDLLKENREGGLSYLRLESNTSERVLESLSSVLELERVRPIMRMYCRALAGAHMEIMSTQELVNKSIGWVEESHAATEGTRVYLPPVVDRYQDKAQNFSWFKVVSTHQVGHLEFGSFDLEFDRPSNLFEDVRWELERDGHRPLREKSDEEGRGAAVATDMGRFFRLFDDRQLVLDVFTALEDDRLDFRLKVEYPGMASTYDRVQAEALGERPPMEEMPLRQAMVELLIRLSLEQFQRLPVPRDHLQEAELLAKITKRLRTIEATVEDSAEATIRVYAILSRLPNERVNPDDWQEQDLDALEEYREEELGELLSELMRQRRERSEEETEEVSYDSPKDVEFRGDFKPEIVQMLNRLRAQRLDGLSREELEELLNQSAELEMSPEARAGKTLESLVQNLMKEAGVPPDQSEGGSGYGPIGHTEENGGPLESGEESTYAYDEWDFRAGDYKPKWCVVRERQMEEGESRFFDGVLKDYASLVADIRRQFELVTPEKFRKIRRIEDGEDLELDAAIEAAIDRRTGVTPSEKVYWRRNKVERDVAVTFLMDMSASTAEAIEEGRHPGLGRDIPGDPVEYMAWLRQRGQHGSRRNYKRIIDLEKESTVLLIQALETIGDAYGIYGFSGYGRENVEFYVVKDMDEPLSDRVKGRLDKISPLHATRMGPAIRHAVSKLEQRDAKTKFVFLISDGRPQDRGYSREGVEREYAVHDTHMALLEARQKGITPFCLTVDKAGHDYLKAMCGDVGYEVLEDIWSLPRRLPMLYRKLTA